MSVEYQRYEDGKTKSPSIISPKIEVSSGKILLFLFAISCFGLVTVGCAGSSWKVRNNGLQHYHFGLWKSCLSLDGEHTVCKDMLSLDSLPGWMRGVQALVLLPCIFTGLVVGLSLFNFASNNTHCTTIINPYVMACIYFISGSCIGIAIKVFSDHSTTLYTDWDLGWTFYLTCASGVMCYLTDVVLLLIFKYTSIELF